MTIYQKCYRYRCACSNASQYRSLLINTSRANPKLIFTNQYSSTDPALFLILFHPQHPPRKPNIYGPSHSFQVLPKAFSYSMVSSFESFPLMKSNMLSSNKIPGFISFILSFYLILGKYERKLKLFIPLLAKRVLLVYAMIRITILTFKVF